MALETTYASRNIGDIFYTLRKDATLNGAVPCTGGEYNISDFSTAQGVNSVAYLIVNRLVSVLNYVDYNAQISANGCCASFGYDEVNGKFKVPTIRDVYVRAGDSATLAKYLAPGLPNITGAGGMGESRASGGSYDALIKQASGAFYWLRDRNYYGSNGGADADNALLAFDASRSNPIYGRTNTVQPPSIVLRPMVQLVTAAGKSTTSDEDDVEDEDTPDQPVGEYRVPYIFVPGTEAKALEVNANFEYVLSALKDATGSAPVVHIAGKETITGDKTFEKSIKVHGIELFPEEGDSSPHLDFHWEGVETDFSSRIYESSQGFISVTHNLPTSASDARIATTSWVTQKINAISSSSSFGGNVTSWTKLPNGLILQYGSVSNLGLWRDWTWRNFPTAFPNACRSMAVSWTYVQGAGNKGSTCGVQFNRTQFAYYPRFEQDSRVTLHWIAIGN